MKIFTGHNIWFPYVSDFHHDEAFSMVSLHITQDYFKLAWMGMVREG